MQFESFAGVRVLAWFLNHPTGRIHFKELCRELKLGPLTVKTYCEEFVGFGWLKEERKANLRIFFLDGDSFVVKALKRAYFLERLRREGSDSVVDEPVISFALYGSHASGEYDEKSDVDLLVVGSKEQVHFGAVKALEKRLGKPLQVAVFPLEKWEKNKGSDAFMLSVLRGHVLLKGMPL